MKAKITAISYSRTEQLLEAQYQYYQDYCNCQTALHNVLVEKPSSSLSKHQQRQAYWVSTKAYYDSMHSVQDNLKKLREQTVLIADNDDDGESRHRSELLINTCQEHEARSRRILAALSEANFSLHANSIPRIQTRENNISYVDIQQMALTTLRASIAKTKQVLSSLSENEQN